MPARKGRGVRFEGFGSRPAPDHPLDPGTPVRAPGRRGSDRGWRALRPRVAVLSLLVALGIARSSEGQAPFTDTGAPLVGLSSGAVAWGDDDNDGDLDLVLTGSTGAGRTARIYRNDGGGNFTDIGAPLTGVTDGVAIWGDYDRDGDLDLLITGFSGPLVASPPPTTKLYRNDGGSFTEVAATGLPDVAYSAAAWGDFDDDGDLDLLLTGWQNAGVTVAAVFRNDGAGKFTDVAAGLTPVFQGSVAWGDYDNDGDLDILLSGNTGLLTSVTRIYRNNGASSFTDAGVSLPGVKNSSVAWGDYDNDGDLDLVLTGREPSFPSDLLIVWVYTNLGGGSFQGGGTGGTELGVVAWGDYDNDGDLDFLETGSTSVSLEARLFRNDGSSFVDIGAGLLGVANSGAAWGDYDNDGDLDLVVTGYRNGASLTTLYRNNAAAVNTPPTAPSGLQATVGSGVDLGWNATSDAQTPQSGLTYNLRVGTAPGASDVLAPMASASGYRRVPAMGSAQLGTSARLRSLAPGTYYWSVQAVDTAFAGSPFASEGSFTVGGASTGQRFFTVVPCRAVDTRSGDGFSLAAGSTRAFALSGKCGVPVTAKAVSANLTVTAASGAGDLRLYPAGVALPLVSAINYGLGQTRANNAIVALGTSGAIEARCDQATGTTELILDVNGYFE